MLARSPLRPAEQICWRQRIEFAVQGHPHVCQQQVGHVVSDERLQPAEEGHRQGDAQHERDQRSWHGSGSDAAGEERTGHTKADNGCFLEQSTTERHCEPPPLGLDQMNEAETGLPGAQVDRLDGLGALARFDAARLCRDSTTRIVRLDHLPCRVTTELTQRRHVSACHRRFLGSASLYGDQAGIDAVLGQQLLVPPGLYPCTAIQHDDLIGLRHRGETMGDGERGAILHQPVERFLNDGLTLRIHVRRRLIEDQDRPRLSEWHGQSRGVAAAPRITSAPARR